jgi:hypothetical protein
MLHSPTALPEPGTPSIAPLCEQVLLAVTLAVLAMLAWYWQLPMHLT